MTKLKLPPVLVLGGTQEFLRRRALNKVLATVRKASVPLQEVSPSEGDALQEFCDPHPLLGSVGPTVVLLTDASSKKSEAWSAPLVALVQQHQEKPTPDLWLVVHRTGEIRTGSLSGNLNLPPKQVLEYQAPKPWELEASARQFFEAELGTCDSKVPAWVVSQVGTDLGVLSFEVAKLKAYAKAVGRLSVTLADAQLLVAGRGVEDWKGLLWALGQKDVSGFFSRLEQIGAANDYSVPRVVAYISPSLVRWYHSALLLRARVPSREVPTRLGVHPFVFEKEIQPHLSRWGVSQLRQFVAALAVADRDSRSGVVAPWIGLEAAFYRHLLSQKPITP